MTIGNLHHLSWHSTLELGNSVEPRFDVIVETHSLAWSDSYTKHSIGTQENYLKMLPKCVLSTVGSTHDKDLCIAPQLHHVPMLNLMEAKPEE